jgi:hypothetical protein
MYNLLVSHNAQSWEGKPYELEKGSRILQEYTDDTLSEHYSKLDEEGLKALTGKVAQRIETICSAAA